MSVIYIHRDRVTSRPIRIPAIVRCRRASHFALISFWSDVAKTAGAASLTQPGGGDETYLKRHNRLTACVFAAMVAVPRGRATAHREPTRPCPATKHHYSFAGCQFTSRKSFKLCRVNLSHAVRRRGLARLNTGNWPAR